MCLKQQLHKMVHQILTAPSFVIPSNFMFFAGRFDEDGSFIGQYVTVSKNKQRISNELTAAVANGATYV